MSGLPWLRLYAETVDDAKLKLLAFEDRWHFIAVLCCKAQGVQESTRPELLERVMGAKLGLATRESDEVKRRLMEVDLIDQNWQPLAWDRRQFVSDHAGAERMRRLRERRRDVTVTSQLRHSDGPDTDTDTDTDTSSLRSDVGAPAQESSAKKKKSPSRIPEDFDPGEAGREYARKALPNVDVEAFIEEFRDYWSAAAGPTAKKLDWLAAYRVRVRNCTRYPTLPVAAQAPAKVVRYDYRGNVLP